MALTDTRPETAAGASGSVDVAEARTEPTAVEKVLGTGDHKTIGRLFIGASLLFLACDLVVAGIANLQVKTSFGLDQSALDRFQLNSPLALLLCGAMPLVLGLAVYLVPLQLGSRSVAFPRAAALSLWGWLLATGLFTFSLLVKGSYGGSSADLVRLGHLSVGLLAVSLLVGAVCVMVTVMCHRPAGMTISQVPFFSFSWLVTGALWLATLPVLLAVITRWALQRGQAPQVLLNGAYPHMTWLFRQPSIYIAAIPLLGIVADVCGSLSGRRQQQYTAIQGMIIAFGALSFGPWAIDVPARQTLMWVVAAVAIGLPTLGVLGGALDTFRRGKVTVTPGLALGVSGMLLLLLAVGTGAVQGIVTLGHDQLFDLAEGGFGLAGAGTGPGTSIGQFYLVIAAVAVGGAGAAFHWGSRLYRGGLERGLGLLIAPLALLGGVAFGAGHLIAGLATPDASTSEALVVVSGIGAWVLALAVLGAFLAVLIGHFGD
jgi:heme/copper-type cytochrome/quinol oxidase subunit 1